MNTKNNVWAYKAQLQKYILLVLEFKKLLLFCSVYYITAFKNTRLVEFDKK